MKFKLDENMPSQVARLLQDLGHDADTVKDEGLQGSVDEVVWAEAQTSGRIFITRDLDFSDIRKYAPGEHWGLKANHSQVLRRLEAVFTAYTAERFVRAFALITNTKVRIFHPGNGKS